MNGFAEDGSRNKILEKIKSINIFFFSLSLSFSCLSLGDDQLISAYYDELTRAGEPIICLPPETYMSPTEKAIDYICQGHECEGQDQECLRQSRSEKYNYLCENLINGEYRAELSRVKEASRDALKRSVYLYRQNEISEAISYLETEDGLNAFSFNDGIEEELFKDFSDKEHRVAILEEIANSEYDSFVDEEVEQAKECLDIENNRMGLNLFTDPLLLCVPMHNPGDLSSSSYKNHYFPRDADLSDCEEMHFINRESRPIRRFNDSDEVWQQRQDNYNQRVEQKRLEHDQKKQKCMDAVEVEFNRNEVERRRAFDSRLEEQRRNKLQRSIQCKREVITELLCDLPTNEEIVSQTNPNCESSSKKSQSKCMGLIYSYTFKRKVEIAKFEMDDRNLQESGEQCEDPALCSYVKNVNELSIDTLYTAEKMQKAQEIFRNTMSNFKTLFSQWRDEGKLTDDQFRNIETKLSRTTLEKPSHPHDAFNTDGGLCRCHNSGDGPSDQSCESYIITFGPQYLQLLGTPKGEIEMQNLIAHELGHAIAPPWEDEEKFLGAFECLAPSMNLDEYTGKGSNMSILRGEIVADWLATEVNAFSNSSEEMLKNTLALNCNTLDYQNKKENECYVRNNVYLYPTESDCDIDKTHPIVSDRLAIAIENEGFRRRLGCEMGQNSQNRVFPAQCTQSVIQGSDHE